MTHTTTPILGSTADKIRALIAEYVTDLQVIKQQEESGTLEREEAENGLKAVIDAIANLGKLHV
jgi:hypothetical protein